ncbi:MAG: folylpolyglutamate synthase/dihydrofolate synthase family protein [Planctomycetota bacterium]
MAPRTIITESAALAARRDAAVAWLMGRINYERVAVVPYNERQLKLDRMRQLLTRLGSPDAGQKIIHVAGTKGKGSTAAMIASVLTAAGLKSGVYSSPHLERIEERWSIDGVPASGEDLVGLVNRMKPAVLAMDDAGAESDALGPPTFFEITTAMALVHFADQQCDAVVLEVGLGGRLDSTNVCLPAVSVITSISYDHTRQLGETLAEIAREKAGIIKPGVPVVSGVRDAEPRAVIRSVARERGCRLIENHPDEANGWETGLRGGHQRANAAVALGVIAELRGQGWAVSDEACREGLRGARLPARVELFKAIPGVRPAVVVDSAHNGASARALVESLPGLVGQRGATLVCAISRDKKVEQIVAALAPRFTRAIATSYLENPRAVSPRRLAGLLRDAGCGDVAAVDDPNEALQAAFDSTPGDGLIAITGSFFLAAELRPLVVASD